MNDFKKSGIHLDTARRERFVDLSDEIQVLGRRFLGNIAASQSGVPPAKGSEGLNSMIEIPDADRMLEGFDQNFIRSLPRGGTFSIKGGSRSSRFVPAHSWEAQTILRHSSNEQLRRIIYEGMHAYSPERVRVLEDLLKKRGELSNVLGKESWADVQLSDKMAKDPSNVMGFLRSLADNHRPRALKDVAMLGKMKKAEMGSLKGMMRGNTSLQAWDRDYYTDRLVSSLAPEARVHPISQYFSAGTVIQGLSRLFNRLYGLRFVPAELQPGEAWDEDVRKVNVVDDVEGVVGVIYFDLFNRVNKSPNAAHYTVRCSRRIDNDDPDGDKLPSDWDWSLGMTGVEDHAGVRVKGKEGRYQLPLVVLTTDFARPTAQDGPSLLAWPEVETLFHEMGHAIHCKLNFFWVF
jgi:intermediate peptidase